ncbi:MAG TPA: hypothetical protein VJA16_23375 [Thermoanaerobaculia bacterium]
MADPVNIPVTVAVTDFNPDTRQATFVYSGTSVTEQDGKWFFNPETGNVTIYELTPATGSPWQTMPLTPLQDPPPQWVQYDGWTITVNATNVGAGASAGASTSFRVSVVLPPVTYVDDPTIIVVDPPGEL